MSSHVRQTPEQIANLQKLANFTPEGIKDFTKTMLTFLSAGNGEQLIEGLRAFGQKHNERLAGLKAHAQVYIVFLKGAFQNNLSANQLAEDLNRCGWPQENVQVVGQLWKRASADLTSSSLNETLSVNKLILPEWRFGITASNKDLKDVGTTFLQLKLVLDRGDGQTRDEYVELTLPQFYEFVATMEKAKAQMDFFS